MMKGILLVVDYFGETYCNVLQHITLRFSELQSIAVLIAEIEGERMLQISRTLVH